MLVHYCFLFFLPRADIVVGIEPLATGPSSTVHGVLTIAHSCVACNACSTPASRLGVGSTNKVAATRGGESVFDGVGAGVSAGGISASFTMSSSRSVPQQQRMLGFDISRGRESLQRQILHFKALDSGVVCSLVR
jgi:hypothetical protein